MKTWLKNHAYEQNMDMERTIEPELMEDEVQAATYAGADFEEPHGNFIMLFKEIFGGRNVNGYVLDIGCGPGDITFRFARAYPECTIHGIDGSKAMLSFGRRRLEAETEFRSRIEFVEGIFPGGVLPRDSYNAIISNSVLHHYRKPRLLWEALRGVAEPGAPVFLMDLRRPTSRRSARTLVDRHASNEPNAFRLDLYNSLLASFRYEEICKQLEKAGLDFLSVEEVGDRHIIIWGQMP